MKTRFSTLVLISASLLLRSRALAAQPVKLTQEDAVIPTYLSGPPEADPMFYFGSQSQGAEQKIYPYPLYDNLTNALGKQTYHLVYLENEYVKIAVAPQLGGRLFSAVDKTNNYDFVYHQHVIKPALIGLTGAWISGGIEWNIPHHHRASTFNPVQCRIDENSDGSKTIWVGELEIRHRMRWAVGYTLRPGSSVLECSVRIINRTPVANTMLCFANVAVNASDDYQIIFPPSTQWVTHHSKREFTSWPIAKFPYGGVNWDQVDVSWYKNHQSANSMFAWNYSDDFFAGYDHGKQAGTMSVADHHVVPGKKFWTWGNGPRGRMWDKILTDDDGPYIELMVGAYSDNQPDYSWLAPYETRSFEMDWYPFRDIGGVKKANTEAAVNLEINADNASFGFYATRDFPHAIARLTRGETTLYEEAISINPAKPFNKNIKLQSGIDPHELHAALLVDGREVVSYSPVKLEPQKMPDAVKPPTAPGEIKSDEELFLAGQRIDQFHDPDRDADPYWEEVLRRDPGDSQAHTGLGRLALRRARYADAEQHFRAAIVRLTAKYTSPKNSEPLYYLGLTLKAQGRLDEAYDALFKATWSQEWKSPAYFSLAEIATARHEWKRALDFINRSLDANALNVRAFGVKASVLRHMDRADEALKVLDVADSKTDPLDVRLMAERWLLKRDASTAQSLTSTLRKHGQTAQEIAAEYASAGLWQEGSDVLNLVIQSAADTKAPYQSAPDKNAPEKNAAEPTTASTAMVYYYLGYFAEKLGDAGKARDYRQLATRQSAEYVFPFQAEAEPVLRAAIKADPQDARAYYYLGNLLFDWQPAEAAGLWEQSVKIDPTFPIAWRNLAQAYAHRDEDRSLPLAIDAMKKAVSLSEAYPIHLAELDQLLERAGESPEARLQMLENHQATAVKNDEVMVRLINLKTFANKTDEAIALLNGRVFSVWEGGGRINTGDAWADAHLVRGLKHLDAKESREALQDFQAALDFPANLRATERGGSAARQCEIAYWIGCAYAALGEKEQARKSWTIAAADAASPTTAPSGNRRGGNVLLTRNLQRYYQALAWQKLGRNEPAKQTFTDLSKISVNADVAAPTTSPSDRPAARTRSATAHYIAGLGYAGLNDKDKARSEFSEALKASPDHLGAKVALSLVK